MIVDVFSIPLEVARDVNESDIAVAYTMKFKWI